MTTNQTIRFCLRHNMTPEELDTIAAELAAAPHGKAIASKAISKGKRNVSDMERQRRSDAMRARNLEREAARKNKNKI